MDRRIEKKKGLRPKHVPYVVAGGLVLLSMLWLVLGNHASTVRVEKDMITVSTVVEGQFYDYVRVSGQVVPIQVVQLSPEEGGIVREKVVEEGTRVKKGDVILRLSNSHLDLQILTAEAELAEKQNLLRNTQVAMQQDRLSNRTELVTLATDMQRRERAMKQRERLYASRLMSREEYLQSREDYELARQKYELVQQRLQQDSIYRSVQMDQMEDNLENMRRNVLLVRERRDRLEVRSLIDGELGLLNVELGQSIAAGFKVGQINDLSDFKVEAYIDEHYIDRVRTGLTATLERGDTTYTLRVRKVYPEVRDGKFRTDLVFQDGRPDNLRIGQTFYLNLELGKPETAIMVPRGTFFQSTGGNWIFVFDKQGHTAYRRTISIGRQNAQYYEVLSGLEPDEQVITSGYEPFGDNEKVVVK